ncbi:cation-transporting P-type ATPase [Neorhodopirellula pilleata]|uniref:Putative cation-transporting ATPase F n=1 Tax=Neorhodopirellula pilleata TaxID=2714738 RepID=A0A5C6A1D7_9BACT|nr:cation-transporting P-type ATPase [Neorhodopirellula pilleata]TWT93644.1 putative cation-transporting ATPase F [Neorhodopirellula pilleata]
MDTIQTRTWHHLPKSEVIELLDTDLDNGLELPEVEDRRERFGPNAITHRQGQGPLVRFLMEFHQPLVYILLAAAVITALLQEWVDSIVIMGVVLVNATIGFVQETKALKAIDALARAMTSEATVMRGGEKTRISSTQLVPGDVVFLQSGDKVPADLRLLACRELQVDESTLTGESVPIEKRIDAIDVDTVLADRRNMVYSSTLVTYGTATGVVVGIGDDTEIGRISELISTAEVLATPLTRKIAHFSGVLLYVILGMAAVTFVIGLLRGESALDMFMAAVALSVGAIPEGLPAAVTITLAIGVGKMAKHNAIIRKLPAVETLGSTTVICSDKTGTLTQNQMTVRAVYATGERLDISGVGYAPDGEILINDAAINLDHHPALIECLKAGLLCNDSAVSLQDDGWKVTGDPTEAALIVSARKAGMSVETMTHANPRLDAIPFESEYQYMATLHDRGSGNAPVAYVKGSVESILPRCDDALGKRNESATLDAYDIHRRVNEMATEGLRVLAFATKELSVRATAIEHADVESGLTFIGLQGMIDPPRPEAVEAVRACQAAGIQVKMITGDHAGTASAIASQIGLVGIRHLSQDSPSSPDAQDDSPTTDHFLTGQMLAELSDEQLHDAVETTSVFARVAPEQKLRLVKALQHRGHVVAMTGDGVNDAPALRRADIGVAMGVTGTEVAKEAADMVLTDDNFSSIESAIEEGREVFDNLIKFITWTLPTNIGEGLVILVAVILGTALPILPVQILWINMTTAVLLGLMLAFEPKEPGIMLRRPRDPASPILSRTLMFRILLVGVLLLIGSFGLFKWELNHGESEAAGRTAAVNVFVFGELFYLFNCRSLTRSMFAIGVFSNPWLLSGVGLMILMQIGFTYLPFMNHAFGSAPIGMTEWYLILGTGFMIYCVVGIEKWLRHRTSKPATSSIGNHACHIR